MITLSPSQIATFELCPRKWAWQYLGGYKPPAGKGAIRGKRVHSLVERWFRDGDPPPTGSPDRDVREAAEMAQALIPLLPPPQSAPAVELHASWDVSGIPFHGYIDLWNGQIVYDHKTTSSPEWAKTPEDLVSDVQATSYAHWAFAQGVTVAFMQWTYVTPKAKAWPVRATFTRETIAPRMAKTVASAELVQIAYAANPSPRHVPYNANACDAFGGCPFQGLCNLTPQERLESIMSQQMTQEEFLARMRGGNGAAPQSHPAQAVAQGQATEAAWTVPAATAPAVPLPLAPQAPAVPQAQALHTHPISLAPSQQALAQPVPAAPIGPFQPWPDPSALPIQTNTATGAQPILGVPVQAPGPTLTLQPVNPPNPPPATAQAPDAPKKRGRKPKDQTAQATATACGVTASAAGWSAYVDTALQSAYGAWSQQGNPDPAALAHAIRNALVANPPTLNVKVTA